MPSPLIDFWWLERPAAQMYGSLCFPRYKRECLDALYWFQDYNKLKEAGQDGQGVRLFPDSLYY